MPLVTHKKIYLEIRSRILNLIREFFYKNGFLEIETPILIPSPGTELHLNAFECEGLYLSTSPEYQMKRLLASGFEKIFQIAKCFRKGERGKTHLPEYTMLEWYEIGGDYKRVMTITEELIVYIAKKLNKYPTITYQGETIELTLPWLRLTMEECFQRFANCELPIQPDHNWFYSILLEKVEPKLKRLNKPVFIYNWPINMASLAKIKKREDGVLRAERVELYIGGLELCNGFTELTDSKEQKERCLKDIEERKRENKPIYPLDQKFITSLDFIKGECCGNALGVDRLVMLFTDSPTIDLVVSFTPEEL